MLETIWAYGLQLWGSATNVLRDRLDPTKIKQNMHQPA